LPLYTGLTISKEIKGVIDDLIHLNAEDSRKDPMQETYVSSVRELMRKCRAAGLVTGWRQEVPGKSSVQNSYVKS